METHEISNPKRSENVYWLWPTIKYRISIVRRPDQSQTLDQSELRRFRVVRASGTAWIAQKVQISFFLDRHPPPPIYFFGGVWGGVPPSLWWPTFSPKMSVLGLRGILEHPAQFLLRLLIYHRSKGQKSREDDRKSPKSMEFHDS